VAWVQQLCWEMVDSVSNLDVLEASDRLADQRRARVGSRELAEGYPPGGPNCTTCSLRPCAPSASTRRARARSWSASVATRNSWSWSASRSGGR